MPSLADKMRQKLAAIEDRIYAGSAKLRSKVLTQRVNYLNQQGTLVSGAKSSWIRAYAFDNHTKTLYMTTHKGKTYEWKNLPDSIAVQVVNGLASCTTDDPTGKKRWFVGKNPSLGAAFWQILKPFKPVQANPYMSVMWENQPSQYSQTSIKQRAQDILKPDYSDILTVEPKYSIDYNKAAGRKRGRPTKAEEKARLAKLNRYKKPKQIGVTP
jgi:hypothetical protein